MSVADENLNPLKKQAIDKENQSTDTISKQRELSMVCIMHLLYAFWKLYCAIDFILMNCQNISNFYFYSFNHEIFSKEWS